VIECDATDRIQDQDLIELDPEAGVIGNLTRAESYPCSRIPPHILALVRAGGLVPYLKASASSLGGAPPQRTDDPVP
jgi:3-isopropylmalate/(R)-2-methylmalate dehydratase small subunit